MWSVGVITYLMLVGKLPFDGKTDKQVIKKVRLGEVDFAYYKFLQLTEEAQSFIRSLLTYSPIRRINAENAINHPWITLWVKNENNVAMMSALKNLSNISSY